MHHDAERNHAAITAGATEIIERAALAALTGAGETRGGRQRRAARADGVPALGAAVHGEPARPIGRHPGVAEGDLVVLDNGLVRAAVDPHGHLVSLIDHADGREAISPDEPANRLRLHRDEPANWDAWDIDEYYRRTVIELDEVDSLTVDRTTGW